MYTESGKKVIDNTFNSKFICFATETYMLIKWQKSEYLMQISKEFIITNAF